MKDLTALQAHEVGDIAKEHITITREWVTLFVVSAAVTIVIASVWAGLAMAAAPLWVSLPFAAAFIIAAIALMVILRSLEYARYSLHGRFEEWRESQETIRQVLLIQANSYTNVSVKGRQNVVNVNSGQAVENIRLVQLRSGAGQSTRTIEGVPECDVLFACDRFPVIGHSQRQWMAAELPSGQVIKTFQDYCKLLEPFLKAELIVDRRERSAGRLVSRDPNELKRALGLSAGLQDAPKDITPAE